MSVGIQHQAAGSVYVMVVDASGTGLDLTLVTSATFDVRKPDGSSVVWTCSRSEQTTTSLTLTHTLLTGDLNLTGAYRIKAIMVTGAGNIWSKFAKLEVVSS